MLHATAAYVTNLLAGTAMLLCGRGATWWVGLALIVLSVVVPNVVTAVQIWRARGEVAAPQADE